MRAQWLSHWARYNSMRDSPVHHLRQKDSSTAMW